MITLVASDPSIKSKHAVNIPDANDLSRFYVTFCGPEDSLYAGGMWLLHIQLPAEYPYKSPSIGFGSPIFHPNVDERSGTVCLDVINQAWSPMYDLVNIVDIFLPQLLLYPNASDPLNADAAAMLLRDPISYASRVREHTKKHASPELISPGLPKSETGASAGQHGCDADALLKAPTMPSRHCQSAACVSSAAESGTASAAAHWPAADGHGASAAKRQRVDALVPQAQARASAIDEAASAAAHAAPGAAAAAAAETETENFEF